MTTTNTTPKPGPDELATLAKVDKMLAALEPDERARVLAYLVARHSVTT